MARAKVFYGSLSTTEPCWWAYCVENGKAVMIRCNTVQDAIEEKDRMKHSAARTVGYLTRKVSELDARQALRGRGWKITLIR